MFTVQPMATPSNTPYSDTPAPKTFGNASPFDPQLFSTVNEFAQELLKAERSGKYSPVEVAQWLEDLAQAATTQLAQTAALKTPEFRRMAIDIGIQAGLGRFFAARFRSGVLYGIHERTNDRTALEEALKMCRASREIWARMVGARGVYVSDVTVGELGTAARTLARPAARHRCRPRGYGKEAAGRAAKRCAGAHQSRHRRGDRHPRRGAASFSHTPEPHLPSKEALYIELKALEKGTAFLWYRHFNQAERFQKTEMLPLPDSDRFRASVPAGYADSMYPVQYYFEIRQGPEQVWLYPGFNPERTNQPYFLVRPS